MPRTVLQIPARYQVRGNFKALFIPRGTLPRGPLTLTQALLNDATTVDITEAIVPPPAGFTKQQADTPAPSMSSLETGTVPGEITYPETSLACYLSKDQNDIRTVLPEGTDGYILLAPNGLDVGKKVNIAEVQVKPDTVMYEDLARVTIPMSLQKVQQHVPIPA